MSLTEQQRKEVLKAILHIFRKFPNFSYKPRLMSSLLHKQGLEINIKQTHAYLEYLFNQGILEKFGRKLHYKLLPGKGETPQQRYKKNHPDKVRGDARRHYYRYRGREKNRALEYQQEHKTQAKEYKKKYREKNLAKINKRKREYYQKNKDKINARRRPKRRKQYQRKRESQGKTYHPRKNTPSKPA